MATNKLEHRPEFKGKRTDFMSDIRPIRRRGIRVDVPESQSIALPKNKLAGGLKFKRVIASKAAILRSIFHHYPRIATGFVALVVLLSIIVPILRSPDQAHAAVVSQGPKSAASGVDCTNRTGIGTVAWNNPDRAYASDNSRATRSLSATTTNYLQCLNFGFDIPSGSIVSGVVVSVERRLNTSTYIQDAAMRLVKGGTIGSTDRSTATTWTTSESTEDHGSSSDLWGTTLTATDINSANFGAAIAAVDPYGYGGTAQIDYMSITVYYEIGGTLDQNGYIWENDDGIDNGSQQSAGNAAITGVRQGERLSLRTQLKNVGNSSQAADLALFYDQNDGNFTKVGAPRKKLETGSGCTAAAWTCTDIATGSNIFKSSVVTNPIDGRSYLAFDSTIAMYVGSGGTGCNSAEWMCSGVPGGMSDMSLAISNTGTMYIAGQSSSGYLAVATKAVNGSWSSVSVDTAAYTGYNPSVAVSPAGVPYVIYANSSDNLFVTHYVGGGTGNCSSANWECELIQTNSSAAISSDIAFSPNGTLYITYYGFDVDYNFNLLRIGKYVGDGSGTNCINTTNWNCDSLDNNGSSSIAFAPNGNPVVAYDTKLGDGLKVAEFGGSGGGCYASGWSCTIIDDTGFGGVANSVSIAFGPNGKAVIAYTYDDDPPQRARIAVKELGTGCSATSSWSCSTIADNASAKDITFDFDGNPQVSYADGQYNNVRIAQIKRAGAITFAPSFSPSGISESHADMTSSGDITNRDDADCIGGGTWQDGIVATAPIISGFSINPASCTEVVFTIDTSQATPGQTYRFVIASADSFQPDKGKWRGPNNIAQYPTLTIENDETYLQASKSTEFRGNDLCGSNIGECVNIEQGTSDGGGYNPEFSYKYSSIAFDAAGKIYTSQIVTDLNTSAKNLRVAGYEGRGNGTGCNKNVVSSATFSCENVETVNTDVRSSIAVGPDGKTYVAYYNNGNLRIAERVGSGGSGCSGGTGIWKCTTIESSVSSNADITLAYSPAGVMHIVYTDGSSVKIAQKSGSTGSGCNQSAEWTCSTIATNGSVNQSLAFDANGQPSVAFSRSSALVLARYVGSGGTGCTGTTVWLCTTVATSGLSSSSRVSLAFKSDGVANIAYTNTSSNWLQYAENIAGSGCSNAAWRCTTINNAIPSGVGSVSLAFNVSDIPSVAYEDKVSSSPGYRPAVATLVGSGGAFCDGTSIWNCRYNGTPAADTTDPMLAYSPTGRRYIVDTSNEYDSYYGVTYYGVNIIIDSISYIGYSKPTLSASYPGNAGRNASRAFGQTLLNDGRSPRLNTMGNCRSIASIMGMCGIYNDDGNVDSITTKPSEYAIFNFSQKTKTNTEIPTLSWIGKTTLAPSNSAPLKLQVWDFAATINNWVDVATDSSSSNCSANNCKLFAAPVGTPSQFYESDGSGYRMYARLIQEPNYNYSTAPAYTLSTDLFQLQFLSGQMRHGTQFQNNMKKAFSL